MEIESLPSPLPLACSTCCEPLTWIYVHHLARNIAVIPLRDVDRFSFRIHTCDLKPSRDWRHVQKVSPRTARRGARRARADEWDTWVKAATAAGILQQAAP